MQALDGKDAEPDADSRRSLSKRHAAKEPQRERRRGGSVEMPSAPLRHSPLQESMCERPTSGSTLIMSNLVHSEQVELAAMNRPGFVGGHLV